MDPNFVWQIHLSNFVIGVVSKTWKNDGDNIAKIFQNYTSISLLKTYYFLLNSNIQTFLT